MILFDLSLELDEIIQNNKLVYWFHFLQTQVGNDARYILIGTKSDVLQNKLSNSFLGVDPKKLNERFNEINQSKKKKKINLIYFYFFLSLTVILKILEENKITLKFHKFNLNEKNLIFLPLNNRELDLKKSGILTIETILKQEYDNVEVGVSTNLKHKMVYDEINILKKDEVFISVPKLKEIFSLKDNCDEIIDEIEKILVDLHRLGVIIYFENDTFRDTIISDPIWFNHVFKTIIDYGRKKVQIIFEELYYILSEKEKEKNFSFSKNKNNTLNVLNKMLMDIKGKENINMSIDELWNEQSKNSNIKVDKISFNGLLKNLLLLQKSLIKEGKEEVLNEIKDVEQNLDITQSIHTINKFSLHEDILLKILNLKFLGKRNLENRKFLLNILVKFNLILPKNKIIFLEDNQRYMIPFLFPETKPKKIILNGSKKIDEFERNFHWKVIYFLPFKPSSVWKMLFLRIRKCCLIDEKKQKILDEIYWINGLIFHYENEMKDSNLIELNIVPSENKNNKEEHLMQLSLKVNENPKKLFETMMFEIKEFISHWIVTDITNKIKFVTKKRSIEIDEPTNLISLVKNNQEKSFQCICSFCGQDITFKKSTKNCELCGSKDFLVENQFAILKAVGKGGFGRIFKAFHIVSECFVAIKERINDNR